MKKVVIVGVVFSVILSSGFVQVGEVEARGASQTAREQASERAIFNRITDWFATVGRSEEEKEKILEERRTRRLEKQAEREARQKQVEERKKEVIQRKEEHRIRLQKEKEAREAEAETRRQERLRQRPKQVPADSR